MVLVIFIEGISQLGVCARGYEDKREAGSRQIGKMMKRAFAYRVLLPVTAAAYQNGKEKSAMRW